MDRGDLKAVTIVVRWLEGVLSAYIYGAGELFSTRNMESHFRSCFTAFRYNFNFDRLFGASFLHFWSIFGRVSDALLVAFHV